jgi:hypothetical protein
MPRVVQPDSSARSPVGHTTEGHQHCTGGMCLPRRYAQQPSSPPSAPCRPDPQRRPVARSCTARRRRTVSPPRRSRRRAGRVVEVGGLRERDGRHCPRTLDLLRDSNSRMRRSWARLHIFHLPGINMGARVPGHQPMMPSLRSGTDPRCAEVHPDPESARLRACVTRRQARPGDRTRV